jgi:hypothetical protein
MRGGSVKDERTGEERVELKKTFDKVKASCGRNPFKWENAYWNCLSDLHDVRKALKLSERKTKEE